MDTLDINLITEENVDDLVFNTTANKLSNESNEKKLYAAFGLTPSNRCAINITHKNVTELLKEIEPYYSGYQVRLDNYYQEEYQNNIANVSIIEIYFGASVNIRDDVKDSIVSEIKTILSNIIYVNDINCNGEYIRRDIRLIPKPVETKWELKKSYGYTTDRYNNIEPNGYYVDSSVVIKLPLIGRVLEIYTSYYI